MFQLFRLTPTSFTEIDMGCLLMDFVDVDQYSGCFVHQILQLLNVDKSVFCLTKFTMNRIDVISRFSTDVIVCSLNTSLICNVQI